MRIRATPDVRRFVARAMKRAPAVTLCVLACLLIATLSPCAQAAAPGVPPGVKTMLARAGIGENSYSVLVTSAGALEAEIEHASDVARNPASTMKLLTTLAALDLLGPEFTWQTEIYTLGRIRRGVLEGDLIIQGGNDPTLSIAKLGELVKAIRKRGVREITGNVLVDRSFYEARLADQKLFHAERQNPINAPPDSMVVNGKLVSIGFQPDRLRRTVTVNLVPALSVVRLSGTVEYVDGACLANWKERLLVEVDGVAESAVVRLGGELAEACGPRALSISVLGHFDYFRAAFIDTWRDAGGRLGGDVHGIDKLPGGARKFDTWISPPLSQVVREINKTSNNLMARQLYLQLGRAPQDQTGSPRTRPGKRGHGAAASVDHIAMNEKKAGLLAERAAARMRAWLTEKDLSIPGLVLDNGAGLSIAERITSRGLVRLLAYAATRPFAATFIDSLPLAGLDGTMRQRLRESGVSGAASLKTGTLSEVRALAGYIRIAGEPTRLIVFLVNDRNAAQAVPAMDGLVEWLHARGRAKASGTARE